MRDGKGLEVDPLLDQARVQLVECLLAVGFVNCDPVFGLEVVFYLRLGDVGEVVELLLASC